ncbi:MAG TPA: hypothetical protein VG095_08725, partial [Chthoniobacterales bacterium]|nr:hypothetical protein [Chthoniobacterales bacterium]
SDPTNPSSVPNTASQLNISTRARIQAGDENLLIGGFIIQGTAPKRVIARAIGPSLSAHGIAGALQDPTLEIFPASGASVFNDNWQDTDAAAIQATGLAPGDARESAIVLTLAPGAYTALVRGAGNTVGVALVEIYDLSPANGSQLRNLSSRALVSVGENVMIGGVIIGAGLGPDGAGSARVLVRGVGPTLGPLGISNPLQDPELFLVNANGDTIAANNNWRDTQQGEIQATGLAPGDNREAALVTVLPKGAYTAILRGTNGTTGVGLVELYHLDPLQAQTFSFEDGFQGWNAKATDVDHPSVEWSITPSQDRASDGSTALKFTLNNLNDAGKIWIERPFALQPNTSYVVNLKFSFGTADYGDLNHWSIIAGATSQPAQTRNDLSYRGSTANGEPSNTGYRWLEKSYSFEATSAADGQLYLQLGIWGTYEVGRTYYFDRVRVALQEL